MTTPDSTKKTDKGPRADENSTVSQDRFENPDIQALTRLPLATDRDGIDRVAGVTADGWEHPPSEVDKDYIKAAEKRDKMFQDARDEAKKAKQAPSLTNSESKSANASQGVGGSGSSAS